MRQGSWCIPMRFASVGGRSCSSASSTLPPATSASWPPAATACAEGAAKTLLSTPNYMGWGEVE